MDRASLQAAQILCALGLGLTLGLFYDFYRIWIRKGRKKVALAIGDLLWWCFALAWTFFWLIQINWAEMRLPVISMVLLGLGLYIFCFSPVFLPVFTKLCRLVGKLLLFIWQVVGQMLWLVFTPIVMLSGLLYKIFYRVFGFVSGVLGRMFGFCGKVKHKTTHGMKSQAKKAKAKHSAKKAEKAQKAEAKKNVTEEMLAEIDEWPEAKDRMPKKIAKIKKQQQKLGNKQAKAAKKQAKKAAQHKKRKK